MSFVVHDASAIIRYRFARETAEFLICARCGTYVDAQMEEKGRYYGIANLGALEGNGEFAQRAEPMDYSGENSTCAPGPARKSLDTSFIAGVAFDGGPAFGNLTIAIQ